MLIGWLFFLLGALCDCHSTDAGYTAEGTHGPQKPGCCKRGDVARADSLGGIPQPERRDNYRNPGVSAFLTSLYVVFTALIAISLGRQSITRSTVIGLSWRPSVPGG